MAVRGLAISLAAITALATPAQSATPCTYTAKQIVSNFSQLFFIEKKPVEAYQQWVAEDYVQHNPIATDGRAAAIKALGPIFAANPDSRSTSSASSAMRPMSPFIITA
jgi:hypothetical protein